MTATLSPSGGLDTELTRIVSATAEAAAVAPARTQVVFRADASGHEAVASTVTLGSYQVQVDEPPALGGDGAAPNPVEYYLASLLSCQIVTYRFFADRLGLRIDEIGASAQGDLDVRGFFALDEAVRPGFSEVRVEVSITGPEDRSEYERLQRVVDAHCPVLDLTRHTTPVVTRLAADES